MSGHPVRESDFRTDWSSKLRAVGYVVWRTERDNGNVHRAAAKVLQAENPRGPRLRVQRIVIPRLPHRNKSAFQPNLVTHLKPNRVINSGEKPSPDQVHNSDSSLSTFKIGLMLSTA